MTDLDDVSRSIGKLEADAQSARNQRETLFKKVDALRDEIRGMHDQHSQMMRDMTTQIRGVISESRDERNGLIDKVSKRVAVLENDKTRVKAIAAGIGIGSGGLGATIAGYWDKIFGGS